MARLRDLFWLWGHPEGCFNHKCGNEGESRMTPLEGILYLGGRNTFMVPMGIKVNRRQYNKSFRPLQRVGWDVYGAARDLDEVNVLIEESREFPNISAAVLDDFIREGTYKDIPLSNLFELRRRLHEDGPRPIDMWMVLYTSEFGLDAAEDAQFRPYIEPFDGIILWTWEERDIVLFEEKWKIFRRMTEGKRRMFGCYLYNFGESKQATGKAVLWQLDRYRELILAGEAEGVVLHTNTMADLDYEAYDAAQAWLDRHGDEEI